MGKLLTNKERGEWLIKNFSKRDPAKFDDETKAAVFLTTYKLLDSSKSVSPQDKIGDYHLPQVLLRIKVGHFIEIINAVPDASTLEGAEIVMGCLYRKDWSKDYSEDEIVETAEYFLDRPLYDTIGGIVKMKELFNMLSERYPLLYDEKVNREADIEPVEDEETRQHDLLHTLSEGVFIRKNAVKNQIVADAFSHLEKLKEQAIKERLNAKQRGY
jgi:hypothetical protein